MKQIGFSSAVAVGLGGIIGAGIFVLSGTMVGLAGTYALFAFLLTGFLAIIISLEMGEMTSSMPKASGASYSFVYNAFGSELGFITGIALYLSFVAGVAAISLGFGSYLTSMTGTYNLFYSRFFAVILIVALMGINLKGLSEAAKADLFIVIFKVAVLIIFIAFAFYAGQYLHFNLSTTPPNGLKGMFEASVVAMFAYAGFQSIATMTPNIKGGGRTAAKAILAAVAISLLLYILVTFAMLSLVPAAKYGFAADPLSFALKYAGAHQWLFLLVDFAALAATTSATLAMIIAGSQLCHQLSVDGMLPTLFLKTAGSERAPIAAVLVTAGVGMLVIFVGNVYIIAAISNFGVLLSYMMTGFALIKIRRMRSDPEKHAHFFEQSGISPKGTFLMPLYPVLPVIGIILLVIFFFGFPAIALSAGVGLVFITLIVYYALREDKDEPVVKVRFFKQQ